MSSYEAFKKNFVDKYGLNESYFSRDFYNEVHTVVIKDDNKVKTDEEMYAYIFAGIINYLSGVAQSEFIKQSENNKNSASNTFFENLKNLTEEIVKVINKNQSLASLLEKASSDLDGTGPETTNLRNATTEYFNNNTNKNAQQRLLSAIYKYELVRAYNKQFNTIKNTNIPNYRTYESLKAANKPSPPPGGSSMSSSKLEKLRVIIPELNKLGGPSAKAQANMIRVFLKTLPKNVNQTLISELNRHLNNAKRLLKGKATVPPVNIAETSESGQRRTNAAAKAKRAELNAILLELNKLNNNSKVTARIIKENLNHLPKTVNQNLISKLNRHLSNARNAKAKAMENVKAEKKRANAKANADERAKAIEEAAARAAKATARAAVNAEEKRVREKIAKKNRDITTLRQTLQNRSKKLSSIPSTFNTFIEYGNSYTGNPTTYNNALKFYKKAEGVLDMAEANAKKAAYNAKKKANANAVARVAAKNKADLLLQQLNELRRETSTNNDSIRKNMMTKITQIQMEEYRKLDEPNFTNYSSVLNKLQELVKNAKSAKNNSETRKKANATSKDFIKQLNNIKQELNNIKNNRTTYVPNARTSVEKIISNAQKLYNKEPNKTKLLRNLNKSVQNARAERDRVIQKIKNDEEAKRRANEEEKVKQMKNTVDKANKIMKELKQISNNIALDKSSVNSMKQILINAQSKREKLNNNNANISSIMGSLEAFLTNARRAKQRENAVKFARNQKKYRENSERAEREKQKRENERREEFSGKVPVSGTIPAGYSSRYHNPYFIKKKKNIDPNAQQKTINNARRRAEKEEAKKRAANNAKRRAEEEAKANKAASNAKRRAEEEEAKKRAANNAKRRAEEEANAEAKEENGPPPPLRPASKMIFNSKFDPYLYPFTGKNNPHRGKTAFEELQNVGIIPKNASINTYNSSLLRNRLEQNIGMNYLNYDNYELKGLRRDSKTYQNFVNKVRLQRHAERLATLLGNVRLKQATSKQDLIEQLQTKGIKVKNSNNLNKITKSIIPMTKRAKIFSQLGLAGTSKITTYDKLANVVLSKYKVDPSINYPKNDPNKLINFLNAVNYRGKLANRSNNINVKKLPKVNKNLTMNRLRIASGYNKLPTRPQNANFPTFRINKK